MGQKVSMASSKNEASDNLENVGKEEAARRDRLKVNLTKSLIDEASFKKYGGKQYDNGTYSKVILWDTREQGLGVRLLPSGAKKFILWYRNAGKKEKLFTLGDCRTLSVDEARKRARKKRSAVDDGIDPMAEKKELAQGCSFAEAAQRYLDEYSSRKISFRDDRTWLKLYLLPAFSRHKLKDITRAEVKALHRRIGDHKPHTANRVLSLISMIFKKAVEWELLPEEARNPASNVEKCRENCRTRILTPDEAARLLVAVDKDGDLRFRVMVRLYLHLGVRKNELLKLEWKNVRFDDHNIVFENTKDTSRSLRGRMHVLRPPEEVWELLTQLWNLRETDNPYVFPGGKAGEHLKDIKRPWERVRKSAGLEDVSIHDLRRSFGTWLGGLNFSAHSIQVMMNHKQISTSQHYVFLGGSQTEEPLRQIGEIVSRVEKKARLIQEEEKSNK